VPTFAVTEIQPDAALALKPVRRGVLARSWTKSDPTASLVTRPRARSAGGILDPMMRGSLRSSAMVFGPA